MTYDLLVIGGGPGGYVAAVRAAQLGARVALVERESLGGTCLNHGCIPTKALAGSAGLMAKFERAVKFGIVMAPPQLNYSQVLKHKNAAVQRLVRGVEYLMKKNQITVVRGTALFKSRNSVEIQGEESQIINAEKIIIATGSEPAMPAAFGYDGKMVLDSTDILAAQELPKSLIIIGGGVVGCEFAGIFNALGVPVTIVEMADRLLPMADGEVSRHLTMAFKRRNIEVRTGVRVEAVTTERDVNVALGDGTKLSAARLLVAIGRSPYTRGLELEAAGVRTGSRGEVLVNANLETNTPGIYAIGDVNNLSNLAHAASAQGTLVAERLFAGGQAQFIPAQVPGAIFTMPELAMVGETEEQLQSRGVKYLAGKSAVVANGKSVCDGEDEGFAKVLTGEDGTIFGVHIVAAHAAELIHEAAVAYRAGLNVRALAETIHVHPSVGEMVMEAAAAALGRAIH